MTPETPPAVSQQLVERFAKAFADFVKEVTQAALEAAMDPALSSDPALLAWQTRALPSLEQQDAAIQGGVALYQAGETGSIGKLANEARGLAKQLDGFSLDFAGPKHAELLDRLEGAVVVAAYQICKAARTQ
ncbi:MAG: hypothetical protein ACRD3N_10635 [Terracidiphilus sp.]